MQVEAGDAILRHVPAQPRETLHRIETVEFVLAVVPSRHPR
jgi:hypothetical protein